jgi:hypothetical protein
MNNPDHISQSIKTICWVKLLKFFDADPGSGMGIIWIRDKHPGSATLPASMIYRVAAIFPEQFESFTEALKIVF